MNSHMQRLQQIGSVLPEAASDWLEDSAARMGAALAFYSILSLAPLLLIALGLAGLFFDQANGQQQLLGQMTELVGNEGAEAIREMIDSGTKAGGTAATAFGVATLLFGASGGSVSTGTARRKAGIVRVMARAFIRAVKS